MSHLAPFSEFIKALPQAKVAMGGVAAHLLAAPLGQVVFFELPAGTTVPPHSHGAQWGIVVDGEVELTIGGDTKTYRAGDSYAIGDGQEHSGTAHTDCLVIDVFSEADRYAAKE